MDMADNASRKSRGKKDRATAEAVTAKHRRRRVAKDAARKAACAQAREGGAVKAISRAVRQMHREAA